MNRVEKELIQNLEDAKKTATLMGHNAGIGYLANNLANILVFWIAGMKVVKDLREYGSETCAKEGSVCMTGGYVMGVFYLCCLALFYYADGSRAFFEVRQATNSVNIIADLIYKPTLIDPTSEDHGRIHQLEGEIQYKSLSFKYPGDNSRQILSNFNLKLKKGEIVALVGGSGSGKSTLASLICRFYDPNEGQVLIDDIDLRAMNLKKYREQIAVVSQEPKLFAGTVLENIRIGNPTAGIDQVIEAAKKANCDEFIQDLPKKYETKLGFGGTGLSGGQKQRIVRVLNLSSGLFLLAQMACT